MIARRCKIRASLGPISMFACLIVVGCADRKGPTTRPMSMHDRQDAAMRDPFGYDPDVPDVSGGGISHFDKQGFDRDVDHMFNP